MTAAGEKLKRIVLRNCNVKSYSVDGDVLHVGIRAELRTAMLETLKVAAEIAHNVADCDCVLATDCEHTGAGIVEIELLAEAEALKGEKERG